MNSHPLISVIVPCYNQAQFLPDALQSVLNQSYQNWECIIVNDGSPDNTEEIAMQWCEKDKRFKYLQKANGGLSSARNAGVAKSLGEYILPLDADDKISSGYLEECVKEFVKNVLTKIVYGRAVYFDAKQGEWDLPSFNYNLLLTQNIVYCTAMYKKADWEKTGGYDEQIRWGWEDWDFWLCMIDEKDIVTRIDTIVFYYRVKESSMIKEFNSNEQKMRWTYDYIYLKHAEKINRVIGNPIQLYIKNEAYNYEINQIKQGAKALGMFGNLMLRTLTKVGRMILNK